jgi:hypothetical protein
MILVIVAVARLSFNEENEELASEWFDYVLPNVGCGG